MTALQDSTAVSISNNILSWVNMGYVNIPRIEISIYHLKLSTFRLTKSFWWLPGMLILAENITNL